MEKSCIACGMPLEKAEDYPLGDTSRNYCVHCAHKDGTMKSYDEALAGMTKFIMWTQGMDEESARDAAQSHMQQMPAWKKR